MRIKGPASRIDATFLPTIEEICGFEVALQREFRGTRTREGLVFRGRYGWAEWAPFPEYDDVAAARWLAGALEWADRESPSRHRDRVPVNAIVPALTDSDDVYRRVLRDITDAGCTTVKIKIAQQGQGLEDDVARVDAVRRALDDAGVTDPAIRLDANGMWPLEVAVERLAVLTAIAGDVEYVEQPCGDLADCARVRDAGYRVAVDEGVRLAGEATTNTDSWITEVRQAADVLILKAIPLGGIERSLALARRVGLPVTVSGSLDTSVGLSTGIALAAALPELDHACGLGTGSLLAQDLITETTAPVDGFIAAQRCAPEMDLLAEHAMAPDRLAWWSERLARCAAIVRQTPIS